MTSRARLLAAAVLAILGTSALLAAPRWHGQGARAVEITVDARDVHQLVQGFGANYTVNLQGGAELLGEDLRHRALEALFGEVHLNTGIADAPVLEATSDGTLANDDDDPRHINWSGFQGIRSDAMAKFLLDRPEAASLGDVALSQRINTRWGSPWLAQLRRAGFDRYAAEAAEQVLAGLIYWRDTLKRTPRYVVLFNEPTTGNMEVSGGTVRDVVELVKRVGRRLAAEGFQGVRFVVPNEETEVASLATARAILADSEARRYVGAIGYHPYPYGSPYASVPSILASADRGRANGDRLAARRDLRDLGKRYQLPVWMTEVSHGEVDARSFDDVRGRAIQIHDEFEYADASAYFGMNAIWDMRSQQNHFGSTADFWGQEGSVVLVDQATNTVQITGIGYAMGHYARWLSGGAMRLGVKSDDQLVLVSVFRDVPAGRLVAVVINNAADARTVHLVVPGVSLTGDGRGEQSTAEARWAPLSALPAAGFDVPAKSVTTVAWPWATSTMPIAR